MGQIIVAQKKEFSLACGGDDTHVRLTMYHRTPIGLSTYLGQKPTKAVPKQVALDLLVCLVKDSKVDAVVLVVCHNGHENRVPHVGGDVDLLGSALLDECVKDALHSRPVSLSRIKGVVVHHASEVVHSLNKVQSLAGELACEVLAEVLSQVTALHDIREAIGTVELVRRDQLVAQHSRDDDLMKSLEVNRAAQAY